MLSKYLGSSLVKHSIYTPYLAIATYQHSQQFSGKHIQDLFHFEPYNRVQSGVSSIVQGQHLSGFRACISVNRENYE